MIYTKTNYTSHQQVNTDAGGGVGHSSQGELLSRRCVALLKLVLRSDVWPNVDLKVPFSYLTSSLF